MSLTPSIFLSPKHDKAHATQELCELPLEMIAPNHAQPRRCFDETALMALAGSLSVRGVLQPVLVRPLKDGKYRLIVGERRWRAAQIAGLQSIPALVCPYDDGAALEAGLIENMAREDLTLIEKARACAALAEELGLTHEQVGQRVGRSRGAVSNLVRLLNLSEEILELLESGKLSQCHGRSLLMAKDPEVRSELARAAIQEEWNVRILESRVRESNTAGSLSNNAVPAPRRDCREQRHDLEHVAPNIARVWGNALGTEVQVRILPGRKLRVELAFDSPEGALALGGRLGEAVARGSKRR